MKIAIWHNLPSGGGKRALVEQVKGLLRRGHVVESWCPPTASQSFLPLGEWIPEHVEALEEVRGRGRGLRRLAGPYDLMRNRLSAMEDHCRRCAVQMESRGCDVLLAHPCTFFRTSPIGRHVAMPSLLYLQEPYRWFYEALPKLPWPAPEWLGTLGNTPGELKKFLREGRELYAVRLQAREEAKWAGCFKRILVNSLYSRESVLRAYGLEAHFCRLGVDTEHFQPARAQRGSYAIGLGSLYMGKGVERAVRGLGCVREEIRPELVWVGNFSDPGYEEEIRRLARQCGVRLTVKVMVSDEELIELLSAALCLVYTPRLEPFGFAPLEANACGTAAIGLAEGGVRETVVDGENGFLVTSPLPEALGEAIARLAENRSLADRMGRRARQHVEQNWSWESAIDQLESHLAAAVHGQIPRTATALDGGDH